MMRKTLRRLALPAAALAASAAFAAPAVRLLAAFRDDTV